MSPSSPTEPGGTRRATGGPGRLRARGFGLRFTLEDADGHSRGEIVWPTYPTSARNGWLKDAVPATAKNHVRIDLDGRQYLVEYDIIGDRPGAVTAMRYVLTDGGRELASGLWKHAPTLFSRSPAIEVDGGGRFRLSRDGGIFSDRYKLEAADGASGSIHTVSGSSFISRLWEIDLPFVSDDAVKAFIFFLTMNRWRR